MPRHRKAVARRLSTEDIAGYLALETSRTSVLYSAVLWLSCVRDLGPIILPRSARILAGHHEGIHWIFVGHITFLAAKPVAARRHPSLSAAR